MEQPLIEVNQLSASVRLNNGENLEVIRNATLKMFSGQSYAIVGKSGSGKTSLISILGLLNASFGGEYLYNGMSVKDMSDNELSLFRSRKIGFVFQNYSLIKHLKVWENVELPIFYTKQKISKQDRYQRVIELLTSVGLETRKDDYPSNLSGGEQQRVAISRALVTFPEILICDEPTGALDQETSEYVMTLLKDMVKQHNTMLILVTHDLDLARTCDTILHMDNGVITDASDFN